MATLAEGMNLNLHMVSLSQNTDANGPIEIYISLSLSLSLPPRMTTLYRCTHIFQSYIRPLNVVVSLLPFLFLCLQYTFYQRDEAKSVQNITRFCGTGKLRRLHCVFAYGANLLGKNIFTANVQSRKMSTMKPNIFLPL
jgi:hypothetical protein